MHEIDSKPRPLTPKGPAPKNCPDRNVCATRRPRFCSRLNFCPTRRQSIQLVDQDPGSNPEPGAPGHTRKNRAGQVVLNQAVATGAVRCRVSSLAK
jgi:hypothetical protein